MKKLLTLLLSAMLCLATCFAVACSSGNENPPKGDPFVAADLAYGVAFDSTGWASSQDKKDITFCENSKARIYTNTDTSTEVVDGLVFNQVFDAEEYADATANDVLIGALLCPNKDIVTALEFEDNDKIVNIKLYEKANGTVSVNGFTQVGDDYELACHVREFPSNGGKNTLDIACAFYVKIGETITYLDTIESTLEVAALNSLNKGGYSATTVTALEGLIVNETVTISFDANGGSEVASIKVFKNSYFAEAVEDIKSSHTNLQFAKWQMVTEEDEEEVLVDYDIETKAKADIVLRAFFVKAEITTAEELYTAIYTGCGDYYLANDIDMYDFMEEEGYIWGADQTANAPYYYIDNVFSGTLDGRNHKITGIHGGSGGNGNYGFIGTIAGKITNCYFEINAGYCDWQGNYGTQSFGTLASYLLGEVSNCVFNITCYKDTNGSSYHRSQGLFAYLDSEAVLKNILVIDNSTDPYMEFRSLISSYAAETLYEYRNVEDVVFIRTNLAITTAYPAFLNGFYSYLPVYKTTGVQDLYLCGSFADATTADSAYTLSADFYDETKTDPNAESYWEISSNVAMNCLTGITYEEGVVSLNGVEVYEVEPD